MYYRLAKIIRSENTMDLMVERMNETFDEEINRQHRFRIFNTKKVKLSYEGLGRRKSEFRRKISDIFKYFNIYFGVEKKL